jgi:uncharacterized protein (DUF427 family)
VGAAQSSRVRSSHYSFKESFNMSEYPAYPAMITPINHVEPVPRRIRATLAGETVLDTTRARYVWESPYYPQYYVPTADIRQ